MEDLVEIFSKNLNTLMDKRGENLTQLSDRINVAYSTVSDWQHGRKMPRAGSLQKLANHFGVNITYLTTDHTDEPTPTKTADLADDDIIFTYQGKPIDDADKNIIRRLMDGK